MQADKELLESYARHGEESAFRELVQRHIDMVYAAALRESSGNTGVAEDITQAVFIELARQANALAGHPALAGWLYTCVRRMTANVRRADQRRQRREQEAFMMHEILGSEPADDLWQQVRPVIDDAMHELDEEDRAVVVLRFFEGKSFRDVGTALGLNENAARMRCERSLERLRNVLSRRGVTSTAATLAVVLTASTATSAPAALASTVATAALTSGGAGAGATAALAKMFSKTQFAVSTVLVGVVGLVVWSQVHSNRHEDIKQPLAASNTSGSVASPARPTKAAASAKTTTTAATSATLLQVIDAESGEPIPGAKIHAPYFRRDGRSQKLKRIADRSGKVPLDPLLPPAEGLNLFVTAEGHVPMVRTWGYGRPMPAEYTMKLERGATVTGKVMDEAGQPIAGATIEVDGPGNDSAVTENIQFGPDAELVSDTEGRWSCNMIPKGAEGFSLLATHPEHAETKVPIRGATGESVVIVMKSGFNVAGKVETWDGNPIQAASVREVRSNEEGERSETTDASGAFQLKALNAGEVIIAVQANRFAPQVQTIQVTGLVAGLRFKLNPGQLLRGRLVDEEGNPVGDARAETTPGRRKIQWSSTTDADGRFVWDSAPREPLLYSFEAAAFKRIYALELQADGSEHEIKLTREKPGDKIHVTGTALDADSGQPLGPFKVMFGEIEGDHPFPLSFLVDGNDGNFTFSLDMNPKRPNFQIQIESKGYVPVTSKILSTAQGDQSLAFQLHKGSGPSGIVLLPSGEPAASATVLLSTMTPGGGVSMDAPGHMQGGWNFTKYRAQTDQAGRFTLPSASNPDKIVAVHDDGYAEAPVAALNASGRIMLQPWGRIEGRVVLDGEPFANERVVARNSVFGYSDSGEHFALTGFGFETKTDSAGNFSFDKVPPGTCNVYRQTLLSRTGFESHETSVTVNPGAVTQVVLGGNGRAVIGKATVGGATTSIDWERVAVHLKLKTGNEPGLRPKRADFASREAFIQASDSFHAAIRAQIRFGAMCNADGSFRAPDVSPGEYKLEITARGFNPDSVAPNVDSGFLPEIASFTGDVTVPDTGDSETNEPLDIGTISLKPH